MKTGLDSTKQKETKICMACGKLLLNSPINSISVELEHYTKLLISK